MLLRRLRRGWEQDSNPFDRLGRPPDFGPRLRLCLHTASLVAVPPESDEALITRELVSHPQSDVLDLFRTAGATPEGWAEVPAFQLERFSHDTGTTWARFGDCQIQSGVAAISQWGYRARKLANDHDAWELLAAAGRESDLVITARQDILEIRDEYPFTLFNLMSPVEAFPIVGVWSRFASGAFRLSYGNLTDWYPWIVTRGLTPAWWPGFSAIVAAQYTLPDGEELCSIAGSVLSRLSRLIDTLERMAASWLRTKQHGVAEALDAAVLGTAAIQDNLAILAGFHWGVRLKHESEWTVWSKSWRRAVTEAGGQRGKELVEFVQKVEPFLRVGRRLRHHAAHRSELAKAAVERSWSDGQREVIQLPAPILEEMRESLDKAGESLKEWGISGIRGPEIIPVTVFKEDGEVERHQRWSAGTAELDPCPFAVKLVGFCAAFANRFLDIIDPASDPRLSDGDRARARRAYEARAEDWLFGETTKRVALLAGPLSGADWSRVLNARRR